MLTFADLFAGVGGFHLALSELNCNCVYACELDKYARQTYSENFDVSNITFQEDITTISDYSKIPKIDILCAGVPCQPWSIAYTQKGFIDPRGNLFFNTFTFIKKTAPKVVFIENVKNLISHGSGKSFSIIKSSLEDLGYKVTYKVLNATEYGNLPQNRERVILLGFRDEESLNFFKWPDKNPLTADPFTSIIDINKKTDKSLYQTNLNSPSVQKILEAVTEKLYIYQYRRYYMRKNSKGLCPTLTANMGTGGHNVPLILDNFGVRKLSPRECFSLQGFPDTFKLPNLSNSHLYKQAGNSVPVPMIKLVANSIINSLKASNSK